MPRSRAYVVALVLAMLPALAAVGSVGRGDRETGPGDRETRTDAHRSEGSAPATGPRSPAFPVRPYDGPARHVVVVSLDTTRPDFFGAYGNSWMHTPRLDRFARDAMVLTNYVTVVTTTLSSHTSLFTGKYPHHHGIARNGFRLAGANVTLAEILQRAGFHTAAFVGAFPLDPRFGLDQGFDHYDHEYEITYDDKPGAENERPAASVTDAALAYLDAHTTPEHLFMFVHYFDPHSPYVAHEPYYERYAGRDIAGRQSENAPCTSGRTTPTLQKVLARYASEISYVDAQLGRLFEGLQRRGLFENALIVVTSDHGEEFRGLKDAVVTGHGMTTREQVMRTVGIIRFPGGRPAGRIDELVSNIDLFPSLLRYLGLPEPDTPIDGTAFDLRNPGSVAGADVRYGQTSKPVQAEIDGRWPNLYKERALRAPDAKLVQTPFRYWEAFYDLDTDRCEHDNLLRNSTSEPDANVGALRAKLERWAKGMTEERAPYAEDPTEVVDPDTRQRLEALGYTADSAGN